MRKYEIYRWESVYESPRWGLTDGTIRLPGEVMASLEARNVQEAYDLMYELSLGETCHIARLTVWIRS